MECPRCGSIDVKRGGPHHTEFECCGKCLEEHPDQPKDHEWIYFQYDVDENVYCWPAPGVMHQCHAEELQDVRDGKKRTEFI